MDLVAAQNLQSLGHPIEFYSGASHVSKQNEATEYQDDFAILTSITIPCNMPLSSKVPALIAPAPGFPRFSKLPVELRLMIWKEALPRPRLVEVNFRFKNDEFPFGSELASCATRTSPPAILGVCHESRTEALKHYSMCFAVDDGQANICFDLKVDIMFIACDDLVELLCCLKCVGGLIQPCFQGLCHLAIGICSDNMIIKPADFLFLMEDLRGLETFTLVLHEKHDRHSGWQDVSLQEVAAEKEPLEYRNCFNRVMDDRSSWMPGTWRQAPALRFMGCKDRSQ
jgi:hypothetical protein